MVCLLGLTVCVYKCYRKRSRGDNQLSNAIKKGLKESTSGNLKKSPSLRSTTSVRSTTSIKTVRPPETGGLGGPSVQSPLLPQGGKQHEISIPEKRVAKSPSQPFDPTQFKTECYIQNEKEDGNKSPVEKTEKTKEQSEDDLKKAKLGSLQFTVEYDKQKTALVVTIMRASELPAKDPNIGSSDPYVKLQLLPEKRHKVKTRVLRKTLNPVYDEIFTFYGIDYNQVQGITLHFVVLSFDRFSRDDIIGEVIHPLSGVDLSEQEVTMCKEIAPRHIKVSIPTHQYLFIHHPCT